MGLIKLLNRWAESMSRWADTIERKTEALRKKRLRLEAEIAERTDH